MDSPCDDPTLAWGYTPAFRAVVRQPRSPAAEPAKLFSFLPAALPAARRQAVFDALASSVLADPAAAMCSGAKMALKSLLIDPDRVVVVFYCNAPDAEALRPVLARHARAARRVLVKEGLLAPRDGFLGAWQFKTDAQTTRELDSRTHPAYLSRLVAMGLLDSPRPRPRPRR